MAGPRGGWRPPAAILALALAVAGLSVGCGQRQDDAALLLEVGPPSDAATVTAAADVVRARLAGLGIGGSVVVDGERLRLDVPPAAPGSSLLATLTDARRLRILAIPPGGEPPEATAVDPKWTKLVEATGPVPTETGTDQVGGPSLTFTFTGDDAQRLAEHTAAHVGESLAFSLGDELLALPVIQSPIEDGRLTLTLAGDVWSPERLKEVAALVSSGPLPAPVAEDSGG